MQTNKLVIQNLSDKRVCVRERAAVSMVDIKIKNLYQTVVAKVEGERYFDTFDIKSR